MYDCPFSGGPEGRVRPPRRGGAKHFSHPYGRSPAAVLVFLSLFAILMVFVFRWYLIPTLEVYKTATHAEKMKLGAIARLILALLLFTLFAALTMTFRIGRFFFPRPQPPRTKTQYVDAWAEAGRRASVVKDEDPEADEPEAD